MKTVLRKPPRERRFYWWERREVTCSDPEDRTRYQVLFRSSQVRSIPHLVFIERLCTRACRLYQLGTIWIVLLPNMNLKLCNTYSAGPNPTIALFSYRIIFGFVTSFSALRSEWVALLVVIVYFSCELELLLLYLSMDMIGVSMTNPPINISAAMVPYTSALSTAFLISAFSSIVNSTF